ncbi:cob(I)yrinic acid a,c-diamide adenosyltransferase [Brevundimonas sp.]|uniref:cob(I)yrinic acid a,c-diamide adenosyltransferase n=1 Tax=Brevundimonas sp. TaxID=1871086 RepID=UPI002737D4F1|nr:cob(I)yrinic acid a,c-diamide adenosyltransferase [Brevundimonas sp.]MDP3802677.1 cob(I)yrinic acid a,c-diamide adenosyltransferase [Brevundimonas sp.]
MVVLNRIYTKTGDGGRTRLASGAPVSKSDARVEAYGAVDELNSVIGTARLHSGQNDRIDAMLGRIQNELFDLGADLATPLDPPPKWEALRIVDSQVERLETEIDWMNESLKELDSFILPGGSPLSAYLHLARTVARRAEREAVRLVEAGEAVTPAAVRYLNRLSDHLFVAARRANANGADDVKWKPGATRQV